MQQRQAVGGCPNKLRWGEKYLRGLSARGFIMDVHAFGQLAVSIFHSRAVSLPKQVAVGMQMTGRSNLGAAALINAILDYM